MKRSFALIPVLFLFCCGSPVDRPDMDVLVRKGGASIASLEDARASSEWTHTGPAIPNFGYGIPDAWARFHIENPADQDEHFIVEVGAPYLDRIDFFAVSGNAVDRQTAGDMTDFAGRRVPHRNPAFALHLQGHEKAVIYLHAYSRGAITIPVRVWQQDQFLRKAMPEYLLHGLYFGTIASLLVYNLIVFVFLRDRSYLFYCMYLAFTAASYALLNGFAQQFIFANAPFLLNQGLLCLTSLAILSVALFNRDFLESRRVNRIMDRVMVAVCAAAAFFAAGSLVLPYETSVRSINLLIPVASLLLFWNAILAARKGVRQSRYFLIAWVALVAGTVFESATYFFTLPLSTLGRFGTQLGTVAEVILFSVALGRRIRVLTEEKAFANQKLAVMEKDMELARSIQERILPAGKPRFEAPIHVTYNPLRAVGGDFYDFFETGGRQIGILIADVTGHGVAAALDSSTVKVAFRSEISEMTSPANVLSNMNQFLADYVQYRFVSAYYAFIDLDARTVRYASAGHPPLLVVRGKTIIELTAEGMLLGISRDSEYQEHLFHLEAGDRLLLYTDGLFEGLPGEDYSTALQARVIEIDAMPLAAFAARLVNELAQIRPVTTDDITLVALDVP